MDSRKTFKKNKRTNDPFPKVPVKELIIGLVDRPLSEDETEAPKGETKSSESIFL